MIGGMYIPTQTKQGDTVKAIITLQSTDFLFVPLLTC